MFEKQNHSFDSMGQLYLIFPIADLCTAYCTSTWYKWYHTADAKLESCQSKGSCWLRKWFLLSRFDTYWLLQYLRGILIKQLIDK